MGLNYFEFSNFSDTNATQARLRWLLIRCKKYTVVPTNWLTLKRYLYLKGQFFFSFPYIFYFLCHGQDIHTELKNIIYTTGVLKEEGTSYLFYVCAQWYRCLESPFLTALREHYIGRKQHPPPHSFCTIYGVHLYAYTNTTSEIIKALSNRYIFHLMIWLFAYGVCISMLIRYSKSSVFYHDFLDRRLLQAMKLLNQKFLVRDLRSILRYPFVTNSPDLGRQLHDGCNEWSRNRLPLRST